LRSLRNKKGYPKLGNLSKETLKKEAFKRGLRKIVYLIWKNPRYKEPLKRRYQRDSSFEAYLNSLK